MDLNRVKRNTAGAKAPDDIAELCRRAGYKRLEMPTYPADKNKIYQIMVFTKGKKYYSYKKLFLGPVLMTRREPLVKEYYLNELKMKQQLLKIMPSSFTSKRRLLKREIKYLEAIIKEI